jgi:phospholipid/cholesterol/gamma-HCH transport system substrate-binding protein
MSRRSFTRVVVAAAAAVALAGCGFKGAYSLPLPGGSGNGPVYHVKAIFADVQDLVPMSAVRVNDVAVGDVTGITTKTEADGSIRAVVSMRIKKSVHLPANAVATLEQTTLLGEKYVALSAPPSAPAQGTLADGAMIDDNATSNLPDVEELFGVLSAVLNGGSLQDLQTINLEISKALGGREQAIRSALTQVDKFVADLDGQRRQIVHALDELDRFSGALRKQNSDIATALDNLGPGLKVLADERAQFTQLLTDLSRFGQVATRIITASRQETIAGLRDLKPILGHLAAAGSNLPRSLELLITFPFPRDIGHAVPGDYNGLSLSFNANPLFCLAVPVPLPTCSTVPGSAGTRVTPPQTPGLPGLTTPLPTPSLPSLPSLPSTPGDLLGKLLGQGLPGLGLPGLGLPGSGSPGSGQGGTS